MSLIHSKLTSLINSSRQNMKRLKNESLQLLSMSLYIYMFTFLPSTCCIVCGFIFYHIGVLTYEVGLCTQQHIDLVTSLNLTQLLAIPDLRIKLCYLLIEISMVVGYLVHWYKDWGAEERGSHPRPWFRNLRAWKYVADYFPIMLVSSKSLRNVKDCSSKPESNSTILCENEEEKQPVENVLDPKKNYLLGYHPHGIMGTGAFINFATEGSHFSDRFPGMKSWLTTLGMNFNTPVHRDIWMSYNIVAATYESIVYLLNPEKCGQTGNVVVVVLGGADEALDARPSNYIFHMNKRYGLFKLALMTGSDLIPCVSFGENNMYDQISNPKGSLLRRLQDQFTKKMSFSNPLFYARGLYPYKTPVTTVIGDPIPVEKNENPTREEVAALKERYCKALKDLFHEFKPIYDPTANDVVFV